MIYEIRFKKYINAESIPLEKYFKNKKNALRVVEELNKVFPNRYFINEVTLEDDEYDII